MKEGRCPGVCSVRRRAAPSDNEERSNAGISARLHHLDGSSAAADGCVPRGDTDLGADGACQCRSAARRVQLLAVCGDLTSHPVTRGELETRSEPPVQDSDPVVANGEVSSQRA